MERDQGLEFPLGRSTEPGALNFGASSKWIPRLRTIPPPRTVQGLTRHGSCALKSCPPVALRGSVCPRGHGSERGRGCAARSEVTELFAGGKVAPRLPLAGMASGSTGLSSGAAAREPAACGASRGKAAGAGVSGWASPGREALRWRPSHSRRATGCCGCCRCCWARCASSASHQLPDDSTAVGIPQSLLLGARPTRRVSITPKPDRDADPDLQLQLRGAGSSPPSARLLLNPQSA